MINENERLPTLEEVRTVKEPHGELVSCTYSVSSGGMMFNSDSLTYISAVKKNGAAEVTVTKKEAFGSRKTTMYRAGAELFDKVTALAERENLAAWSRLKYVQPYQMTDVSYSAGISLYYDDSSIGGSPYTARQIDLQAVRQQGGGEVETEFFVLLSGTVIGAEVISEESVDDPFKSAPGFQPADVPPPEGSWKCPMCGYNANTGRFCCECGSAHRSEG